MKNDKVNEALGILLKDDKDQILERIRHLTVLANYKYNEYHQFAPGRYFLESLVTWLNSITDPEDRSAAFDFVYRRLLFFSRGDMYHFTRIAFAHQVRPALLRWAAAELQLDPSEHVRLARSRYFETVVRSAVFLAMSDGARIDDFRRLGALSNEQVAPNYDLTPERWAEIAEEWRKARTKALPEIAAESRPIPPEMIRQVFLVDDFAASGSTIIRKENGEWKGRYPKFIKQLYDKKWPVDLQNVQVHLVLYVVTRQALKSIHNDIQEFRAERLKDEKATPETEIFHVQMLEENVRVGSNKEDDRYRPFIEHYEIEGSYDSSIKKGGPDGHQRWGYKECALPLVLFHNTPNNSIAPLWMYSDLKMPGLFPRVRRHRED